MTGKTKYPILDTAFLPKLIEQCTDDIERGLVYVLYYTGMHGSCLQEITEKSLIKEGPRYYLEWSRPKTHKTMRCLVPLEKIATITAFLQAKKKTIQGYNFRIKRIGSKAGFDGISTMTFRHTRCIRALRDEGYGLYMVPHVMGCTPEVVARNYTKMTEEQLDREKVNLDED